jgi:hypothetical protein
MKNTDGRELSMTDSLQALVSVCVTNKGPLSAVFNRGNGIAVCTLSKLAPAPSLRCASIRYIESID